MTTIGKTIFKTSPILFIAGVCFALILIQVMGCSASDGTILPEQAVVPDLVITLKADKRIYDRNEEIHWLVEYANRGDKPIRILVDEVFIGSNFSCLDSSGNIIPVSGGYNTWSPKAGHFTGRTYLLASGKVLALKIDALVDDKYDMVCAEMNSRGEGTDFQDFKKRLNLPPDYPDKYISAGRRLSLDKPGDFSFQWVYKAGERDKEWIFSGAPDESSVENLWFGQTSSNIVELTIR
ncbi:MAG: hypothetical protein HKM93_01610 [Desulfobacteraceae bacterium]|nr:hypothetical protein [Desulfobacteraceae bacterium]